MKKPVKILVIDDSKLDNAILTDIVKEMGNIPISVYSPSEGLRVLKREEVDLILLDIVMNEMDGYEFLEAIHPYMKRAYLPVIFVTGLESVEDIVKGLEKGATDYIKKPFIPAEVKARIKVALRIKALNDELVELNRKLKDMVVRDSLTNLYNHRYMIEKLRKEFKHQKNKGNVLYFLMIDIDKFKNINDTYGHMAGDEVLKVLSKLLVNKVGESGIVGRYGGEEFAIIAREKELLNFVKELMDKIRDIPFCPDYKKDLRFHISVSIGITPFPYEFKSSRDVIKYADTALYKAKEWGRDMAVIYEKGEFKKL